MIKLLTRTKLRAIKIQVEIITLINNALIHALEIAAHDHDECYIVDIDVCNYNQSDIDLIIHDLIELDYEARLISAKTLRIEWQF